MNCSEQPGVASSVVPFHEEITEQVIKYDKV